MNLSRISTRAVSSAGLVAWAAVVLLPLLALFIPALYSPDLAGDAQTIPGLLVKSAGLAAALAATSVVLGFIPARLVGTSRSHRGILLLALLMPLLLPRYVLYYAWSLLLSPTSLLGQSLTADPLRATLAGTITSSMVMVLWYWPLAALLIAQGWSAMDRDTCDIARLEAGPIQRLAKVTLPQLAWPVGMAFGVCFALLLGEFATFHLAGVRTIGTDLAVIYELTGSETAVARAAAPVGLVGLLIAAALWKTSRRWTRDAPSRPAESKCRPWLWVILLTLLGLSLLAPTSLLIANIDGLDHMRNFLTLHMDGLAWSLATAAGAAAITMLVAMAALTVEKSIRIGRPLSAVMHVTIFLAMLLPGSVVAASLLRLLSSLGPFAALRQSWCVVSAGQASRFAGVALIMFRLARDSHARDLGEMASVDGAGPVSAFVHVRLPQVWPVIVGVFLIVAMFSVTELPASMVLLPAGMASFAQRLLNQMHYARDQQVIASCLILIAVYLALAALVVSALAAVRVRRALPAILLVSLSCLCGCSERPDTTGSAEVVHAFGQTGSGRDEFVYPRAIDQAPDGSVYVIDKNAIIRRFTSDGQFIYMFRMPQAEAGKPTGVTVGPDGSIYVADTHYHRVIVFSPEGEIVRQFGRMGEGPGEFIYPTDVEFAPDGRIYVSEYGGNDRVSVFSPEGKFIHSFGKAGDGPDQFSRPSALCVDHRRARLYVADACNHRIAIYTLDGKLTGHIGRIGRGAGQLRYPYDLALAEGGTLVVCEYGNNRLQLFDPEGRPVRTLGEPGHRLGQLAYPWAVTVDSRRQAYIVDSGNNRIQVWRLPPAKGEVDA